MFCAFSALGINTVPAMGILGAGMAQTAEDTGGKIGDIGAIDPELVPLEQAFKDVSISTDGYPDYRYAALRTPSSVRLLELRASEPPKQDRTLADHVGFTIPQHGNPPKRIWCRIVCRDLSEDPRPEYETISYTWAGLPKRIPIFVDGGRLLYVNVPIYTCLQRLT